MFIDARTVPEGTTIEAEVCVVGAGAAGITLANELIGQSFRVCLLESGGFTYDVDTQALYAGENIGHPYAPLNGTRMRFFGGTTNLWNGYCRPLDEIDFEARDGIPYSGWPFGKAHLDPFYARAQAVCQLGALSYELSDWDAASRPLLPFVGNRVLTTMFQFSPPTRFGSVYREAIDRAGNIRTYLYANVVDIEVSDNAQTVTRLRVVCLPGNTFGVVAKLYILATGGIENARLLLLSNQVQHVGLGNQHDLVGRFFMEHPHVDSGVLLFSDPSTAPAFELETQSLPANEGLAVKAAKVFSLSAETKRREKIGNFNAFLKQASWLNGLTSFQSLKVLARALRKRDIPENFVTHLGKIIADIDDAAMGLYRSKFSKHGSSSIFILNNRTEQIPNPHSRVILTTQRDSLDRHRVALNWQLSEIDKYTLRRSHEIIGQELGLAGLGRLKDTVEEDFSAIRGGHHHMGTTRMHNDSKQGVVDKDCRVHGMSNLFIAGSSVFPTSGCANPTLTIVALSIRLADHITGLMKGS